MDHRKGLWLSQQADPETKENKDHRPELQRKLERGRSENPPSFELALEYQWRSPVVSDVPFLADLAVGKGLLWGYSVLFESTRTEASSKKRRTESLRCCVLNRN